MECTTIAGVGFRLLALAAAGLFAQDATIRVDVRQVVVPVVVTDKKGHHVTGLREGDFQIFEDGVRQQIAAFSTDASAAADDVAALSKSPEASSGPRRTFVVCVDTLHTSAASAARLREALIGVFEKEKTGDAQYVLIGIGRRMQVLQPATPNPQVLLLKLRGMAFQGLAGGADASAIAAELQNLRNRFEEYCRRCACGARPPQHVCDGETAALKQSVDAEAARWSAPAAALAEQFAGVVRELAKLPTGRTMILVSDNFGVDPKRDFYALGGAYLPNRAEFKVEDSQRGEPALQDALKVAADRNVAIYTLDSRGGAGASAAAAGPMDAGSAPVGSTGIGTAGNSRNAPSTRTTTLQSAPVSGFGATFGQEDSATMQRVARSTGGVYFHEAKDLARQFRAALADGREYYVLAYVPTNGTSDGRFRAISVETADKSLAVRTKAGYWAPAQ